MPEPRESDDSLSATVPGILWSGSDTEALPNIEGVPPSEPQALAQADGKPLDLDLDLDLNLDLDYATAAVDQSTQHPQAVSPSQPVLPPVYSPEATHPSVPVFSSPTATAVTAGVGVPGVRQPAGGFSVDAGKTFAGTSGFPWQDRRVLLVSADAEERIYLRARLALAKLVWVDEAASTTQAETAMKAHRYTMAIVNLDVPVVDGLALVRYFRQTQPEAVCVVTGARSPDSGPLGLLGHWRQWQREKELNGTGVEWLEKPLLPKKVAQLFTRVQSLKLYNNSQH